MVHDWAPSVITVFLGRRDGAVHSVSRAGLGFTVVRWADDIGCSRRMVCSVGLLYAEVSSGFITTVLHSVSSKFILH